MKIRRIAGKLYHISRYPFVDPVERAYIRLYVTDGAKKMYKFNDLDENCIVFDVGGYRGDYSAEINKKFGCKCYCFEPVREFAEYIKNRFAGNDKILVYNYGLSDKSNSEGMQIFDNGSSSVIDRGSKECESVMMKDIKEFVDENQIGEIDLMKLNIEGGEYRLLERIIKCDLLARIRHIQIQFHQIDEESEKRMKRIWKELEKTHKLDWSYRPYIWESWTRK